MKILAIFCIVLSVYAYILTQSYIKRGHKIDTLEEEKQTIIKDRERLVKNEVEVRQQNEKLKKQVSCDKSGFDWSYNLSSSPVRKRLSESCRSCKR